MSPPDSPNADGVELLQQAVAAYENDDALEYERLYDLAERGDVWLPTLAVEALANEEIGDVVEWHLSLEEDDAGFVDITIDILALERDAVSDLAPDGAATPEQVDQVILYDAISTSMLEVLDQRSIEISAETRLVLTSIIANGSTPTADDYTKGLADLALTATALAGEFTPSAPAADAGSTPSDDGVPAALIAAVLLAAFALAAGLIAVRRTRANGHLTDIAFTDSLTGLQNRRRLDADVTRHLDMGERSIATLMIDVDNFKQVNDVHGHAVGDDVLRLVGAALSHQFRRHDVPYRYGGEEFCVLLVDTDHDDAVAAGERIRSVIEAIDPPVVGQITVSVGVSLGPAAALPETLQRADSALYDAKSSGRNRVAAN